MTTPDSAPAARRIASVRRLHGDADPDDYAWMRDHDSPDLLGYLAAEREYYEARRGRLAGLTGRLDAEIDARIPRRAEDSAAWPLGGYRYWTRTPEGGENRQHLRSRDGAGGAGEQLLLDENVIAAQTGYVEIGTFEPSPGGQLLAWAADTTGAEIYQLRIRDLRSGDDLADLIEATYPGAAWSAAADYLFYLVPDQANRPFQVWRHEVGTGAGADLLVFAEDDARFEVTLHASRSGAFAVITSASRDTTEVRLIPLADPLAGPVLVRPRRRGLEYRVDHARDPEGGPGWLYIVTNDGASEFTLMRAPADTPGDPDWEPVPCPAVATIRADTRLHACDVIGQRLLLTLRRGGAPLLAITGLDGSGVVEVAPGAAAGSIWVEHDEDYDAGSVIVGQESLVEPTAWYRLDLATGERTLLRRREVPGYAEGDYVTTRILAPAADGTPIPVTLARHRSTPLDGTAPCLLYGYGAYEACSDPEFGAWLPSLLDRGVVYAIAHIRGGGEGGRTWWQQGRLRAKPTTFTDFIDVADWLAGQRTGSGAWQPALVDGRRIVSRGLSAGGLLQGAAYSKRPDRWRAVVAEVPFVDCVNTMLDPSIPLTITEWDEWGDPRDPGDYACIRSYSPYDNPPAGPRPPLLVTGAVHDPRVGVHEPAKWVARLRATGGDGDGETWFRAELGAGAHTGPSGRYAQASYEAEVAAFVLDAMGMGG